MDFERKEVRDLNPLARMLGDSEPVTIRFSNVVGGILVSNENVKEF